MLQYSTYAVISPEGCASILWRTAEKAPEAAEAMGVTAERLKDLGIVDKVIPEPLGGAPRNPAVMAEAMRETLERKSGGEGKSGRGRVDLGGGRIIKRKKEKRRD